MPKFMEKYLPVTAMNEIRVLYALTKKIFFKKIFDIGKIAIECVNSFL